MKEYIIRVDCQDMYNKNIEDKDLFNGLKENGLEILKSTYSSFGACLFMQVSGEYKGVLDIAKIDTPIDEFDWVR